MAIEDDSKKKTSMFRGLFFMRCFHFQVEVHFD